MKLFIAILFMGLLCSSYAQTIPPLERKMDINAKDIRLSQLLDEIASKVGCTFSYGSGIIDPEKKVSVEAKQKSVRQILSIAIGPSIELKNRANYIIILKSKEDSEKEKVSGYVQNENGDHVPNATVYDSNSLVSATTNEYGYYEMKIDRKGGPLQLNASKSSYRDTVSIVQSGSAFQEFVLQPEPQDTSVLHGLKVLGDSAVSKVSVFTASLFPKRIELANVNDTIYRKWQVSFVPFVGTNRKISGNVINENSFNILGGYSLGTNQFEAGGLFNIVRSDVCGVQLAGLTNIVGGNVDGVQASGITNFIRGDASGVILSGLNNVTIGDFDGVQLSGLNNIVIGKTKGISISGLNNIAIQDADGVQLAGLLNVNAHRGAGVQVAGLLNINAQQADGMELAGLGNVVLDSSSAIQVAGLFNVSASSLKGVQVAGLLNVARYVDGTQIGFLNIADSVRGVPIGFLSLVAKGYHTLEFSYNDLGFASASFRSGVRGFYTFFNAGIGTKGSNASDTWTVGYGIGTSPRLGNKFYLNIDASSNHMNKGKWTDELNADNQLFVGFDFQMAKKFTINAGPVIHCYTYRTDRNVPMAYGEIAPHFFREDSGNNWKASYWMGWKVGVRIF